MITQMLSLKLTNIFPDGEDHNKKICDTFHQQNIGRVSIITTTRLPFDKKYGYPMYEIFVFLSVWYDTPQAETIQTRVLAKKKCKIEYNAPEPWFWLVSENKSRTLSKKDIKLLEYHADFYNAEMNAQMAKEDNYIEQLMEQNERIQQLQDLCISNGLEIPFWDAKNPPATLTTSFEFNAAQTAIDCSASLFNNEEAEENAYLCANECAESVLIEEFSPEDFISVDSYADDWITENPYADASESSSRLPYYLGLEEFTYN